MPRILFVASVFTPLAARWIRQLADTDWDIHVYGLMGGIHPLRIHPLLENVTLYCQLPARATPKGTTVHSAWPFSRGSHLLRTRFPALYKYLIPEPSKHLAKIIARIRPDIIHSLKMQPEAYYVLDAKRILSNQLPAPWIYSVWGSDIYQYARFEDHVGRINDVLSNCDYIMADNSRDLELARLHGFAGEILGVFPTGGGYDLQKMRGGADYTSPSKRKIIALKGYQANHGGKALIALEALAHCGDLLGGYKIVIHSAIDSYASYFLSEVRKKANEVSQQCNVPIEFLPYSPPEDIWKLFGTSRISLAISSTDGTPNAMLESMIMGAYPVQSNTGGLEDWITSGVNGELVRYDDPTQIAAALSKALSEDDLVDRAADINRDLTFRRLNADEINERVIQIYAQVAGLS